jgi:hypothetical protein
MLRVSATVDFDDKNQIYLVTVISPDCDMEGSYKFTAVEAESQTIYSDPNSFAAMTGIRLFTEAAEAINGEAS